MKEIKRYFSYLGKYKRAYWFWFIVTILVSIITRLINPYMNKLIFNSVEYSNPELFKIAVILCIILLVINCGFPYLRYFQIRVVRKVVFDTKITMFDKLIRMDMDYYEKNHSADALKTLNWDANCLKDSYFSHVYWVVARIVNGLVSIIAMLVYSPILTLISICFSVITVVISVNVNKQIKKMDKNIQKNISNLAQRLSDILSGFTLLKMYSGASIVIDNYNEENVNVADGERRRVRKAAVLEMVSFLMGILGSFGTIIVGAYLVSKGKIDYGTIMAVVSLQMGVSAMVQSFGSALTTMTNSIVRAGRVFDFLEMDGLEESREASHEEHPISHDDVTPVEIKNLCFAYDEDTKVIENFNMSVANGEKVILMGESGCGKSTLLKLLLRFYAKSSGEIKLYGKDISEYTLEELRKMITYIPQNNYLFEGTIFDNIALGINTELKISDEEKKQLILDAARFAYADEFIKDFPLGYDTELAPGGTNLSGGQRQRIAIARAFLKNTPILLMDEPSSALDVHSEKKINLAMKQLMENKVVLMVTHRMTSFDDFDRVVEVKKMS